MVMETNIFNMLPQYFLSFCFCIWEIHDATGCLLDYYII